MFTVDQTRLIISSVSIAFLEREKQVCVFGRTSRYPTLSYSLQSLWDLHGTTSSYTLNDLTHLIICSVRSQLGDSPGLEQLRDQWVQTSIKEENISKWPWESLWYYHDSICDGMHWFIILMGKIWNGWNNVIYNNSFCSAFLCCFPSVVFKHALELV